MAARTLRLQVALAGALALGPGSAPAGGFAHEHVALDSEAHTPAAPAGAAWTVVSAKPGEGEQCLVCGQRIRGLEVVEVRYQGRTFWVAEPMLAVFQADPDASFAKLQARGALFDEEAIRDRPMGRGWLLAGLYVLAGLVFGAACAYLAVSRALPAAPWFFAGLVGNVVALAMLISRPPGDRSALPEGVPPGLAKVATTRDPRACPACGAANHPVAPACEACGAALHPTVRPETATAD